MDLPATQLRQLFTTDGDREMAAWHIVAWLQQHKENGTMSAAERRRAWKEIAGSLGVIEATGLVRRNDGEVARST